MAGSLAAIWLDAASFDLDICPTSRPWGGGCAYDSRKRAAWCKLHRVSLPPPDKKDAKPKASPTAAPEQDWDDLLGEAKSSGISPDMARALLQMNPAMRDKGVNTAWVVNQSQDAQHAGKTGAKPATAKPATAKPATATASPSSGDVYQLIETHEKRMAEDETRFDLEIKKLNEAKQQNRARILAELMTALAAKDPELLSPFTQQALSDKKAALEKLGFSVKGFAEHRRNSRK